MSQYAKIQDVCARSVFSFFTSRSVIPNAEAALQQHTADKASASKELAATNKFISSLHAECDWLLPESVFKTLRR